MLLIVEFAALFGKLTYHEGFANELLMTAPQSGQLRARGYLQE
jgi:hypothetical protein